MPALNRKELAVTSHLNKKYLTGKASWERR